MRPVHSAPAPRREDAVPSEPRPRRAALRLARALALLALAAWMPALAARAQVEVGTQYVSFWRGDLRILASRPDTMVTLIDMSTGLPLDPSAAWSGNFDTNPFVLASPGDSFEASSLGQTHRIRIVAETAAGPEEPKAVVAWTGWVSDAIKHPGDADGDGEPDVPPDQNAWMSYIPDVVQPGPSGGSELGTEFLGFTSRDLLVLVRKEADPVQVVVEDLVTNVDADSDDDLVLDASSPYLVYSDAELEVYSYQQFEDDTIRVTSNAPASVLVGLSSATFTDWAASPPSYVPVENGRELGTLFYAYVPRWLTIYPVFNGTTVTVTDLSDAGGPDDDTNTVFLEKGGRFNTIYDVYVSDITGRVGQPAVPRDFLPQVRFYVPPGGAHEEDLVKIESDRPVLAYVGAVSSNTFEFADVAYSVPVGPTQQLIYSYAQNGGADDFQLFSFAEDNEIFVESLSFTDTFLTATHHDFNVSGSGSVPCLDLWCGGNLTFDDWFWSSGVWAGEMVRVQTRTAVQAMSGDYDSPNFGSFIPFVQQDVTSPPSATAGPDLVVCPDADVVLDGSSSFDTDGVDGPETPRYEWDLDVSFDTSGNGDPADDVDATGPTPTTSFPPGTWVVQLTFTDDDGESSTDRLTVTAEDVTAPVLECPEIFEATATDFEGGLAAVVADVSDDCDPTPVVTNDRTSGGKDATDFYPCGVTRVGFTATDAFGNFTACDVHVVVAPDGGFPSIGDFLRVGKRSDGAPVLDWSDVTGLPADSRYLVLRATQASNGRTAAPNGEAISPTTWTDEVAVEPLLFYDVRYVKCDGTSSGE